MNRSCATFDGACRFGAPPCSLLRPGPLLTREAGEEKADRVIAFSQMCRVETLDTETALAAAEACRTHRLAPADAIMFAAARAHGAMLLTCDGHFDGLPDVIVIEKSKTQESGWRRNWPVDSICAFLYQPQVTGEVAEWSKALPC